MNRNVIEFPKGPSARKPRGRRVASTRRRSPAARQGGRARTRLIEAVPYAAIAAGWILAFVVLIFRTDADSLTAVRVVAGALFGFGAGWLARDEVGEP